MSRNADNYCTTVRHEACHDFFVAAYLSLISKVMRKCIVKLGVYG
jgi:hypothetical protein